MVITTNLIIPYGLFCMVVGVALGILWTYGYMKYCSNKYKNT